MIAELEQVLSCRDTGTIPGVAVGVVLGGAETVACGGITSSPH
jgi:hypothetical protein